MKYLVTGGAGYIGSHVAKQLIIEGHDVVLIDNLSTGFKKTVTLLETIASGKVQVQFHNIDLGESAKVEKVFKKYRFDGVLHFAASIVVPESVENPLKYYLNNTANTAQLIKLCVAHRVPKFIYSSTAAVYGEPDMKDIPVDESDITIPINPYGWSKLMSERILKDTGAAHREFKYVILRYFNVAGADPDGLLGQSTLNATHLVKVSAEVATKKRKTITVFGDDYATPDGTCVRDYIHVTDLADAHIKALRYLDENPSDAFNCGYGFGFSVREIIDTMKTTNNVNFDVHIGPRRPGDSAILISDNSKIKEKMGWEPQFNDIKIICKTAFEWEKKLK